MFYQILPRYLWLIVTTHRGYSLHKEIPSFHQVAPASLGPAWQLHVQWVCARDFCVQLCKELSGQFSWCWGFHAKTIPSVQGLVEKANYLMGYLISLSHLQWGQREVKLKHFPDRFVSLSSGPTITILSQKSSRIPVSSKGLLFCFQGD